MNNDRFILLSKDPQTGRTRKIDCPICGAKKRFTEYYDTYTNEYVTGAGKCDRVNECGANILAKDVRNFMQENASIAYNKIQRQTKMRKIITQDTPKITPLNGLFTHWQNFAPSVFIAFLQSFFVPETITDVLQAYAVTGIPDNINAVSYWQQYNGIYTTARIMEYTPDGHRDKKNINWAHSICQQAGKLPETYQPPKYLFGAQLIETGARILICESEKTALLATLFNRRYPCNSICGNFDIITATGGAQMIGTTTYNTRDKLRNCEITLSPDIDQQSNNWRKFAQEHNWQINTAHAAMANKDGYDLGDAVIDLVKQDYQPQNKGGINE